MFIILEEVGADSITDADIADEVSSGLAEWRGRDRAGRPCLVITPRLLEPQTRRGNVYTFMKVLNAPLYDTATRFAAVQPLFYCAITTLRPKYTFYCFLISS